MGQLVVGRPVPGAMSWPEEVARTLVAACAPTLRQHKQQRAESDLAHEKAAGRVREAERVLSAAGDAAGHARRELERARHEGAGNVAAPGTTLRTAAIVTAAFALAGAFVHPALGVVLGVVAAVLYTRHKNALSRVSAAQAEATSRHQTRLAALDGEVAQRTADVERAQVALDHEQRAFTTIVPVTSTLRLPIKAMIRVHCPVLVANVDEHSVVVSPFAADDAVSIKSFDSEALDGAAQRLVAVLDRIDDVGALLSPGGGDGHELGALIGEEAELEAAMSTWFSSLRDLPTNEHSLPVIGRDAPLLSVLRSTRFEDDAPSLSLGKESDTKRLRQAIVALSKSARLARTDLQAGSPLLRQIYERLRDLIDRFASRRVDANAILQRNFMAAASRAELLAVHRFCPRCNRIPSYFFHKLGCDLDEAHQHDPISLLDRASLDPDIAYRLQREPGLRSRLLEAHDHLRFMETKCAEAVQSVSGGSGVERDRAQQVMSGHVSSALDVFRTVLREVVTGSPVENVELARAARLHLSPTNGEWTCAACETAWSDPEVARLGEVTRVKSDLLVPLWNALWIEKDDFRKSELFRTNEELTRYVEKEAEKLLFVHESYKADLRGIRENLVASGVEAESARAKLESTLGGLVDLELMTQERAREIIARLGDSLSIGPSEAKRTAEKNETVLGALPRQQQMARPMEADPIRLFLAPRELFSSVATKFARLESSVPAPVALESDGAGESP